MSSTTRRAALTALASVSALALPAVAAAEPLDPIFGAIERHRKAHAAFVEVCGLEDEVGPNNRDARSPKRTRRLLRRQMMPKKRPSTSFLIPQPKLWRACGP